MKVMMILLAFLLPLGSKQCAAAECVTEVAATSDSSCVVLTRDGVRGVWFSLEEAESIREMKLIMPELTLQLSSFERIAVINEKRIEGYQEITYEQQKMIELLQMQLNTATEREAHLRENTKAWYRSPALWLSVGVIVSTAAYVAITFGAN